MLGMPAFLYLAPEVESINGRFVAFDMKASFWSTAQEVFRNHCFSCSHFVPLGVKRNLKPLGLSSPCQCSIPLLQAKVVLSLHWQTSESASCPRVRRGNSWRTEVPGSLEITTCKIDRLGGPHMYTSKWIFKSQTHIHGTHELTQIGFLGWNKIKIVFSDESLDGGVALNVDFMEELSQAVRLVREDLTLLSKAVRDAAMKLSALHIWRSWNVILRKSIICQNHARSFKIIMLMLAWF